MRTKRHTNIFKDFEASKKKHLEHLANKMLKIDERNQNLAKHPIKINILDILTDETESKE
jgi:hypothetical protein